MPCGQKEERGLRVRTAEHQRSTRLQTDNNDINTNDNNNNNNDNKDNQIDDNNNDNNDNDNNEHHNHHDNHNDNDNDNNDNNINNNDNNNDNGREHQVGEQRIPGSRTPRHSPNAACTRSLASKYDSEIRVIDSMLRNGYRDGVLDSIEDGDRVTDSITVISN